jgi:acetyl-CoA C-acetyltransferase
MNEIDPGATGTDLACIIKQLQTPPPEFRGREVHIRHAEGQVVHSGAEAADERGDRGLLVDRSQELQDRWRRRIDGPQDRLGDPLLVVLFAMDQAEPQRLGVELDGCIEIGHCESNMIERGQDHGRLGPFVTHQTRVPDWLVDASVTSGAAAVEDEEASMGSVIVGGARTPIGKLLGGLKDLSAVQLGGIAIAGALERSGMAADHVDAVVMGQVLQAGSGQLPARQAAVQGGIALSVPAMTINKVCLSGLAAVAYADQLIRAGECDVVVAGGMESMTNAPHLLPKSRSGFKYGNVTMIDHMAYDGLWDAFTDQAMGALTDGCNTGEQLVTRIDQDAFAARSHARAHAATQAGVLAEEIVEARVPQRRADDLVVKLDEGIRAGVTAESLAALPPAFGKDGTITAGSSSPISDGAAALVVASKEAAARLGLVAIAEIGAYAQVAGPDSSLQLQPSNAINLACKKQQIAATELDLIEINEAFAAVGVASARALGLSPEEIDERVNVNGGAIALGHPIGASGARLVLTLALALRRRGGGIGAAALCGGGGQGDALIISAPVAGLPG